MAVGGTPRPIKAILIVAGTAQTYPPGILSGLALRSTGSLIS